MKMELENILLFDGHCSLCNGFIDFLIRRDKHNHLKFASLQSNIAADIIPLNYRNDLKTIVYKRGESIYTESTAALKAISDLGGLWKSFLVLLLFPKFLRNTVYRYIARNRYKFFGKKETCRIPTPNEASKILA